MKKLIFILVFLFLPLSAYGFEWSTTYNCPDWNSYSQSLTCDSLSKGGSWTACGKYEQITAAANYPSGGGGKGQRHWIGDGINVNSGSTRIDIGGISEFWVRFYFRFQPGFSWSPLSYQKLLYVNAGGAGSSAPVIELYGSDKVNVGTQLSQPNYSGPNIASASGHGWTNMMGGSTSDGSWHQLETHLKMDTNGSNGVIEMWLDNVQVINASDVNLGTAGNDWQVITIAENQRTPNNGTCEYLDIDDVAVSTTGRIGSYGGGDTTPPVRSNGAPTANLSVGTTSTSISLDTDETATCKWDASSGIAYASMSNTFGTTGSTSHSDTVTGLTNGSSTPYYVRCIDGSSNANTTDFTITVNVDATDTTPPVISADLPSELPSGTTSTPMIVATDETATCKYDTSDVAYGSMANTFTTTGSTSHQQTISGMSDGNTYTYYVRCTDGTNANTSSYVVSWTVLSAPPSGPPAATVLSNVLFTEDCDDANFAARNWYDNTAGQTINTTTKYAGTGSCQYDWDVADTQPNQGGGMRRYFPAQDELWIQFYAYYSVGYVGSGQAYHPHEIYMMSEYESQYEGPAYAYLTMYIENNALVPKIAIQDSKNINTSYGTPPIDLTGTTESRAVAGCNGYQDAYSTSSCYYTSKWYNDKGWYGSSTITTGAWHKILVHIKLNTSTGSTTNTDGVVAYWLDDVQVIDKTNVVMRTSDLSTMKLDKFMFAPYIGDGSPVIQSVLFDSLEVAGPQSSPAPPVEGNMSLGSGNGSMTIRAGAPQAGDGSINF